MSNQRDLHHDPLLLALLLRPILLRNELPILTLHRRFSIPQGNHRQRRVSAEVVHTFWHLTLVIVIK